MKSAQKKIIVSLAATALLVAVVGAISFWAFKQIGEASAARKHTYAVMNLANDFLSSLIDAETGQRGYALTGDESFLEPYLAVRDDISGQLQQLRGMTKISAASAHLDAVAPLLQAKLTGMAQVIELRRTGDAAAVQLIVSGGQGKRAMDSIRTEMRSFLQLEQGPLEQQEDEFQSNMRRLFTTIVTASLLALLFAVSFAHLNYRETQNRLKSLILKETQDLLELQEETNLQLQQANVTLQVSEQKLAVTLNSIGDGVIATDAEGRVTLLNPLAETLTGWKQAEAAGRPVEKIFNIISQETRQPSATPVKEALARGTVQALANHTLLISRDGSERAIADSCAPICDLDGDVIGAVLVFRDVTEEYEAQQSSRDSTALVQAILNTVADGIITLHAGSGEIETVNPAAEQMFGYAAAELVGKNFSLLIPELDRERRAGSLDYVRTQELSADRRTEREVEGRRKDGSRLPIELAISNMWLGGERHFTGILRDFTASKQIEERLRWTEESFRLMVESVTDYAIVMLDPGGCVLSWNSGAQRIKGYSAEEIVGQHFSRFYPAEAVALGAPQRDLDIVTAKGRYEDEGWRMRKDGSVFWANVAITAIRDQSGNLRGFAKLTRDLTELRKVEAELTNAKSSAEKANFAKSYFLSSMSHELRSPLNAILGFAQLMESDVPAPTAVQKESIAEILKAGWHLLTLINEILDLAKVESGQVPMSKEPVSLSEVVQECERMIEPQAQQRGIRLVFPPLNQPFFALADRTRVKQVLINLLSNAIKYNAKQGTVEVNVAEHAPGRIRVSVRDTGAGLAPEQLAQLYQPFNRLGQEGGGQEGTGIGLVVAKRLVELMDGVVGVESAVGEGSVFWFELCAVAEPSLPPDGGAASALGEAHRAGGVKLRTLLYVEDNPANLKLVEQIIARHPEMRLLTAVNATLGIELARNRQPEVILMDINLPGISGIEALKILRQDPATANIPVIAISANAMPLDIESGMKAGFLSYLTKPIKVTEFIDALRAALEGAGQRSGRSD